LAVPHAFDALADPRRRAMLEALAVQERSVGELAELLALRQPATSKHLAVLRDAGLVADRHEGRRRIYRLVPEPLVEVDDWLTPFREAWSRRFDALAAHLDAMEDP